MAGSSKSCAIPTADKIGFAPNIRTKVTKIPIVALKINPILSVCLATPGRFDPIYCVITATIPEEITENIIRNKPI